MPKRDPSVEKRPAHRHVLTTILVICGAFTSLALGWWALPLLRSGGAAHCATSPTPRLCRALHGLNLTRAAGPSAAPAPADLAAIVPASPDLSSGDLGVSRPRVALEEGEHALRQGWWVTAHRLCEEVASATGPETAAALLCQGRAALGMGWPQRAAFLAGRALALPALERPDEVRAHLLLGDANRSAGDCRSARTAYLRALDLDPSQAAARRGLDACGAAPPPAPHNQMMPDGAGSGVA